MVFRNIEKRLFVGIMLFLMTMMAYMTRVNMSICIVAMVKETDVNSTKVRPDYGERFDWSQKDQGWILASYFYGYFVISIPAGTLAENFGGKQVIAVGMTLTSLMTALTPVSAHWHKWAVFWNRFIIGVLGGTVYPSCHNLISKWAPPDEKGKFVAALMGNSFGTVITWPICGLIIEYMGWDWAFYIVSVAVLVVSLMWIFIVADSPSEHSSITPEELAYIRNSLGGVLGISKRTPPYAALLKSPPFLSLAVLHFGDLWGLFFLITATPKYLSEALQFDVKASGFLSSVPQLARFTCNFIFGAILDAIRYRNLMSNTASRKFFCIFSHVLPGLLLIALGYLGKTPYVCLLLMTISLGLNGAATCTNLQNSQDLAPNFAGTLYGLINFVGTTAGFISPMVVAYFTKEESTIETWHYIFLIGGIAYILPAVVFWVFGSGDVQKWNEIEVPVNQAEGGDKSKAS